MEIVWASAMPYKNGKIAAWLVKDILCSFNGCGCVLDVEWMDGMLIHALPGSALGRKRTTPGVMAGAGWHS